MALTGAHTSTEAKQCPLIQSNPVQSQTHSCVTMILQNVSDTEHDFSPTNTCH